MILISNYDKVVLITGAAKRIGRFIALALAEDGYSLIIHYNKSEKEARKTRDEIISIYNSKNYHAKVNIIHADLSDETAIRNMIKQFGTDLIPRILINNASNFISNDFDNISVQEWNKVMNINLRAPFLLSKYFARLLKEKKLEGSIINISDMLGVQASDRFIPHGASKAALIHMTKSIALSLAPNIRVNVIIPGLILPPEDFPKEKWDEKIEKVLLKKSGHPRNITQTVKFLILNDFITGTSIKVDGGEYLTR